MSFNHPGFSSEGLRQAYRNDKPFVYVHKGGNATYWALARIPEKGLKIKIWNRAECVGWGRTSIEAIRAALKGATNTLGFAASACGTIGPPQALEDPAEDSPLNPL
jgi:hypothetical protein